MTKGSPVTGWSHARRDATCQDRPFDASSQAKGVDRDDIEAALEQVSRDDELRAARALAGKKLDAMAGLGHDR